MTRQEIDDLIKAICRCSAMIADNVGLVLKANELEYIYESVGQCFVKERITQPYVLTVGDVMARYSEGSDD